ncbi:peptidoglycan-binding protein [Streptomyces sp. JNUCC 64]
MDAPVFEEVAPASDCHCPGCADRRRAAARGVPVRLGGDPAAHGARRQALVLAAAAGTVLSGSQLTAVAAEYRPLDRGTGPAGEATAFLGGAGAAALAPAPPEDPAVPYIPRVTAASPTVPTAPAPAPGVPAPGATDADGGHGTDGTGDGVDPGDPNGVPDGPAAPNGVDAPDGVGGVDAPDAAADVEGAVGGPAPQGAVSPLFGPLATTPEPSATPVATGYPAVTRAEIIRRAKTWVDARVPYSMTKYWPDGYRQDCSGFVSMVWGLKSNEWTGSLARFADRITKDQLKPGDMLLFHDPANPNRGSHVTIFGGWTDYTRQHYIAYEQTPPRTVKRSTPYPYWNNKDRYVPYRYRGVKPDGGGASGPTATTPPGGTAFPGAASFGPGARNRHVTELGRMLVERGGARFYRSGPGPDWGDADRGATRAFQRAQGWTGPAADGIPGPATWDYLKRGKGRDIPRAAGTAPTGGGGGSRPGASARPGTDDRAFPGRGHFRPGQSNAHVTRLGKQLQRKGFGAHYSRGPGPRWGESDRRNVEAFQRAQGWRGRDADGYPGPETWRRLFS